MRKPGTGKMARPISGLEPRPDMTIVAGFLGSDFALLAADSEETGTLTKGSVRKIARLEKDSFKALIGGAGNGDFIDLAVQQCDETLTEPSYTLKDLRLIIEKIVTAIYSERLDDIPERQRSDNSFELLCALWVPGSPPQLVKVRRAVSLILKGPAAIGIGSYLANYIIATFGFDDMDMRRTQRLATYLLAQVKAHVAFCGGESQVMSINSEGNIYEASGLIKQWDETSTRIAMMGASSIVHFADPAGMGFDLTAVDDMVDKAAATVKSMMHSQFDGVAKEIAAISSQPKQLPITEVTQPTAPSAQEDPQSQQSSTEKK